MNRNKLRLESCLFQLPVSAGMTDSTGEDSCKGCDVGMHR